MEKLSQKMTKMKRNWKTMEMLVNRKRILQVLTLLNRQEKTPENRKETLILREIIRTLMTLQLKITRLKNLKIVERNIKYLAIKN
jgi:hypothetical protein